ncbi:molecular chaperone SurA [Hylemonella gracilis str. Niagara R]|uniref:Chaperone SurA n=1 Tax=Hylemonella gracilis str. Niagara R TaxID=1458275 RepID=A0A016XE85_9BURK|nr:peptidylprolyl isomerase [Hylemonella gracilis]EYC49892.1 molecular chaperone SurA [Hylemonella gracilis str. Niagara R]
MNFSLALGRFLGVLAMLAVLTQGAHAQGTSGTSTTVRSADYIVAVVNSEPITNAQVNAEMARALRQYAAQRRPAPAEAALRRQVLDQLINERAQLQLAREMGLKVDEPSVDQAEQNVARQNQMTVAQLRQQVQQLDGMAPEVLRNRLRDQLLLTRLREREVDARVRVSDADVEQYLVEQQQRNNNPASQLVNIAHILVAVPEDASAAREAELQRKAEQIALRARDKGADFAALARELSDAGDRVNGGQLGLRAGDRYPALFTNAVRMLAVGQVSDPVRSGAGFHVLKLIERRQPGLPPQTVTQSRARHILLIPSAQLSEAQARDKLNDFRRRIVAGETDFATLARQNSQDGSAAQGGDLGWANPGMFVPEFEGVMNQLAPGQISEPLISRFGVHLIQLLERRQATLNEREQRELIRNMLRERKMAEAYDNWVRDTRARAYVELREAPQ